AHSAERAEPDPGGGDVGGGQRDHPGECVVVPGVGVPAGHADVGAVAVRCAELYEAGAAHGDLARVDDLLDGAEHQLHGRWAPRRPRSSVTSLIGITKIENRGSKIENRNLSSILYLRSSRVG